MYVCLWSLQKRKSQNRIGSLVTQFRYRLFELSQVCSTCFTYSVHSARSAEKYRAGSPSNSVTTYTGWLLHTDLCLGNEIPTEPETP
ncbi:hypothetical protein BN903_29 [Halorubrum sp. AJ67]|nr:hypothetical protein BN903_29 [Halorubrum sp. AJ67]